MSTKAPRVCPACQGELESTTLVCKDCSSQMTGNFTGCRFCNLSDEEEYFTAMFIKYNGSIKEMEKELGISYPTVKNRLSTIASKIGVDQGISKEDLVKERLKIIDQLSNGEISVIEASELIKKLTE